MHEENRLRNVPSASPTSWRARCWRWAQGVVAALALGSLGLEAAAATRRATAKSDSTTRTKSAKPEITPRSRPFATTQGAPSVSPDLPDSIPGDLRAGWALRARIGRTYWPDWAATVPAPVLIRSRPFDFFVNHPGTPGSTLSPTPIPGGGGVFETVMNPVPYPKDPRARIEMLSGRWTVSLPAEGGRPGARSEVATLLAYRDFLAYEGEVAKPVWVSTYDTTRVRLIRQDPDLRAWLDQEGLALRQAVAASSESARVTAARKAIAAWKKADERAQNKPVLANQLRWIDNARRFEGPARYLQLLIEAESRSVAAGDTAARLPAETPASTWELRQRTWQAHAASMSDRSLQGAHLGTVGEVGALYCVLLDAWYPGWRKLVFATDFHFPEALEQALASLRNRRAAGG